MAILRYTVGVTLPDAATSERWLAWLRNGHIAEVLAGGATSAEILCIDGATDTYEIDYRFPTREAFAAYERDHAPRLREEGRQLFPPEQGIVYRRSTAELVQVFSGAIMIDKQYVDKFRVEPGRKVKLKDFDTGFVADERHRVLSSKEAAKERAAELLEQNRQELATTQDLLYADDRYAILVVLQAMDAAGKDGTIKHVMSGLNPQGCQVYSFKQPSSEELDHTFLWRCMTRLPERGRIGIFNRSYYEDVLVVKVHPEYLERQKLPAGKRDKSFWQDRYDDINAFEHHLVRNGTIVVKFYLHVSKQKQKERFLERLERPEKHWKFSHSDLAERAHWDDYMKAYEDALSATSTEHAPWYVIPADHKWVTRTLVADILMSAMRDLDLRYPEITAVQKKAIEEAKKQLSGKGD